MTRNASRDGRIEAPPASFARPWGGPRPREIAIVMLSALGDAVHVLPVAAALKRAWPECRLTWILQPLPHRLVAGHPAIDDFVVFRRRRGAGAWRAFVELQRTLQGRRFDLLLALQVYFKAGLVTALTPATVKLGFDRRRARDLNWLFTNRRIPRHSPQHVQDQYLEFVRFLGIEPEPVTWDLSLTDAEREAQRAFFARLGRPACAVVLGTSRAEKNWTAEGYARVVEALDRTHGLQPVFVGGTSRIERKMAAEVRARTHARVVDARGDDVRRLLWLLEGSALTLSPDTGPLHISRAVGTPVIGLYGYTNPKRSGPYRAYEDLVADGYARFPGEVYPASLEHRDGMKRVLVPDVLEKVALAVRRYVR